MPRIKLVKCHRCGQELYPPGTDHTNLPEVFAVAMAAARVGDREFACMKHARRRLTGIRPSGSGGQVFRSPDNLAAEAAISRMYRGIHIPTEEERKKTRITRVEQPTPVRLTEEQRELVASLKAGSEVSADGQQALAAILQAAFG